MIVAGLAGAVLAILWLLMLLAAWQWTAWWLIFALALVPITLVFAVLTALVWFVSKRLLPRHLSKDESQKVEKFNDKLFGLLEHAQTPLPLLGLLFAFDVLRGQGSRRIRDAIDDSDNLRRDFGALKQLFADTSDIEQPK